MKPIKENNRQAFVWHVPIKNDLKQGNALSPVLFNYALEYAIRRVEVNQKG